MFMTFGLSGHVHDSQNQLFLTMHLHLYFKQYKNPRPVSKNVFGKYNNFKQREEWKRRVLENP